MNKLTVLVLLGTFLALPHTVAGQSNILKACGSSPTASPNAIIAACTHLIDIGGGTDQEKAAWYRSRAFNYYMIIKIDLSIADFEQAVALDGTDAQTFYNRGIALNDGKFFDRALASYDKAILLRPEFGAAFANRAALLRRIKRYDEALVSSEQAVKLEPKNPYNLQIRGSIFESIGRRVEAISDYRAALEIDPLHHSALEGLARLGVH
jgi:tetratricopeptide (TPR) repeat protein